MHRFFRDRFFCELGSTVVFCALMIVVVSPCMAQVGEVQGVHFDDGDTIAWSALEGVLGYHIYQAEVGALGSGYGECAFGSLSGTSAQVTQLPPVGTAFSYLVAGFDGEGQGSLGEDSEGAPREEDLACTPARRLFPIVSNGVAGDGVEDGQMPRLGHTLIAEAWDPGRFGFAAGVVPATGEMVLSVTDLSLRGRGIDFTLDRSYRSQVDHDGAFGHNWFSPLTSFLRSGKGGDIVFCDGEGRCETFGWGGTGYASPPGQFARLFKKDSSYALRGPDGTVWRFHLLDGSSVSGALSSVEDRLGNRRSFLYDSQGLLTTIVTSLGKSISLSYDEQGRIVSASDDAGREVVYSYDSEGDLVSVRSPVVKGTPNGNDFPSGKTVQYSYSNNPDDPHLAHNLLTIANGSGAIFLQNTISSAPDNIPADLRYDRVLSQELGGINASGVPAGGTVTYAYEALNSGAGGGQPDLPRRRVTVTSPGSVETSSDSNVVAHELSHVVQQRGTGKSRAEWRTERRFDEEGRLQQVDLPGGASVFYTWDVDGADRYRQGNLLEKRIRADAARGDGHGGDARDLVWSFEYEPLFGEVITETGPKGNDSTYTPPNGGAWSADRYETTYWYDWQEGDPSTNGIDDYVSEWGITFSPDTTPVNQGDLNADGATSDALGALVRRVDPTVKLTAGSRQALDEGDAEQESIVTWRYNSLGQVLSSTDPTGLETTWSYHPETDPEGDGEPTDPPADGRTLNGSTGGFLASLQGANVDTMASCVWNSMGQMERVVDGRGVLSVWIHNELGQLVESRAAAATSTESGPDGDKPTKTGEQGLHALSYKTRFAWDASDRLVSVQREDRGATRAMGTWLESRYTWDLLGRLISLEEDAAETTTLLSEWRYDAEGNPVRWIAPEGDVTTATWDERGLMLEMTVGAEGPGGATPATTSYTWNADGDLVQRTGPEGHLVDWERDGFGRSARVVDELGGVTELFWDPASDLATATVFGIPYGAYPVDRNGSRNVRLSRIAWQRDEHGRVFRTDRDLFLPDTVSTMRPVEIAEGGLLPGDGALNRRQEYDAAGRQTYETNDHEETTAFTWNEKGQLAKRTLPDGSSVETWYDAGGNLIEMEAIDLPSASGSSEHFLTSYFYDALDQREMVVDNLGRTVRFERDSLGDLVLRSDADGPAGGTIHRRSPGHSGEIVAINGHGNVVKWAYDGLGRLSKQSSILTASGHGDGSNDPTPDTSNPWNPAGLIEMSYLWDGNSRLVSQTDIKGEQISFSWDRLDRLVQETWPDDSSMNWAYDRRGLVTQMTLPDGAVIDVARGWNGEITSRTVLPVDGIEGTTLQTFEYDGLSRLTKATDNNNPSNADDDATLWRIYDSVGRLVEEQQRLPSLTVTRSVDYAWNAESQLSKVTSPEGRAVVYTHDDVGRLSSAQDSAPSGAFAAFDWIGFRRLAGGTAGNGVSHAISWDGIGRLLSMETRSAGTMRSGFQATYLPNSLESERELHDPSAAAYNGYLFTHDSARRLIRSRKGDFLDDLSAVGDLEEDLAWTLDGTTLIAKMDRGDRSYLSTPNNLGQYDEDQTAGSSYDDGIPDDFLDDEDTPEADGKNFAHDLAGNQTKRGDLTLRYDGFGRLVRVLDGDSLVSRYKYDALGRLTGRIIKGSEGGKDFQRVYYRALGRALEERDGSDVVRLRLGLRDDGLPLWQEDSAGIVLHRVYDTRGDTAALLDINGNVQERVSYSALGVPFFETHDNVLKHGTGETYLARSDYGLEELFGSHRYLWELGDRGTNLDNDWGGVYSGSLGLYDPNQGKEMGAGALLAYALFQVEDEAGGAGFLGTPPDRRVSRFKPGSDLSSSVKSMAAPGGFKAGSELADKVKSAAANLGPHFRPGSDLADKVKIAAANLGPHFRPGSDLADKVKIAAGPGGFKAGSELADKVKSAGRRVVKFKAGSELADKVKSAVIPGGFKAGSELADKVKSVGRRVVKFKAGSELSDKVKSAVVPGGFKAGSELSDKVKSAALGPHFRPGSDLADKVKCAIQGRPTKFKAGSELSDKVKSAVVVQPPLAGPGKTPGAAQIMCANASSKIHDNGCDADADGYCESASPGVLDEGCDDDMDGYCDAAVRLGSAAGTQDDGILRKRPGRIKVTH